MRTLLLLAALALPTHAAYQYAVTDQYSSQSGSWTTNGTLQWYVHGLSGIGSRILYTSNPAVGSEHEVRTVLSPSCTTTYFHYLRATQDANILYPGTGTFYAVELQPTCSPGQPTTVRIYKRHSGTLTLLAQGSAALNSGDVVRSLYRNGAIHAYINADFYLSAADTAISSGQPGVGSNQYTAGGMTIVQLGAADTVAPSAPDAQKVSISTRPTQIDLQWAGAPDDANGIGVRAYRIYRNGVEIQATRTPEFTDTTVSPSTTYNYGIQTLDWHRNVSSTTTIAVTTAPPNHVDPQRIGVNSLGTYWGAAGEQIDLRSGNLNFTLPLVTAAGRGKTSIPFSLNYNSQLWRKEDNTVFRQGRDIGYGFGWRLLAGSITPAWSDYFTIHHWVFTDSTGAEYRLDVNSNGRWTSREGFYGTFDANQNILYFNDGTHWFMGAESAGAEEDAGTRYPTTIRDANGNQIFIRYRTGVSAPWSSSSGRIDEIEDARAKLVGSVRRTFAFTYLNERLTAITNEVGSAQAYTFHVLPASLTEPFTQATFPATTNLTAVTQSGTSLTHHFSYYGTTGELQRATLPFGGYLEWTYRSFTYLGARTLREVLTRSIRYSASAPIYQYEFIRDDTADQNLTYHNYTLVREPNNGPTRKYWFAVDPAWGAPFGYLYWLDRATSLSGGTVTALETYSWTTDSSGRPYIWATNHVLDPYDAAKKITSRVEQSLDADGNLVWRKLYDYGTGGNAATTPNRTYNYTYVTSSAYRDRYLRGLLSSSTVTGVGGTYTLASVQYDQTALAAAASNPLYQHDSANYGTGFTTRGNPTTITQGGVTSTVAYDITGSARTAAGAGTSVDLTPSMNNMVPGIIKPGGDPTYQQTVTYNDTLDVTQVQSPNSTTASTTYSANGRPISTVNVNGWTKELLYDDAGGSVEIRDQSVFSSTEGLAKQWTRSYRDSFGRTVKLESGKIISGTATTVSKTRSEFAPCACSPIGKLARVSLPYVTDGSEVWTTHTYDALGRTVNTAHAGGLGSTSYEYKGVAGSPQMFETKVTSGGTWKKYYTNGLGELVKVSEPNPAGGADLDTIYSHNSLGKLTTVSMTRNSVTQTRTFVYNTNGQLTSASNPENGTTTYTYWPNGKLATKIDARNTKEQYTYDSLGRLSWIHRWSGQTAAGSEQYQYDTALAGFHENPVGRLIRREQSPNGQYYRRFVEDFSYTPAGQLKKKRLTIDRLDGMFATNGSLTAEFSYDHEGRLASMTYPSSHAPNSGGTVVPGVQAVYGRNAVGHLATLTVGGQSVVSSAYYNTAGQLQQLNWDGWTEDRWYNVAGQMWKQQIKAGSTVIGGWEYNFPGTNNNGRITGAKDLQSLEEITYQYDALNRLVNAAKTGGGWGEEYTYDGFGNLTRKGASTWLVDAATNRLHSSTGAAYDANGNLTGLSGGVSYTYDLSNRLTIAYTSGAPTGEDYGYTVDHRRVWKKRVDFTEEVTFWGPSGRLATYQLEVGAGYYSRPYYFVEQTRNVWFGSRLLRTGPAATPTKLATDRLGSIRLRQTGANPIEYLTYAPYGEQRSGPAGEGEKFATYYRDQTNLDYADQRYFSGNWGRFSTPDPYETSAGANDPTSWNRYTYVEGDPINKFDPPGLASWWTDSLMHPGQLGDGWGWGGPWGRDVWGLFPWELMPGPPVLIPSYPSDEDVTGELPPQPPTTPGVSPAPQNPFAAMGVALPPCPIPSVVCTAINATRAAIALAGTAWLLYKTHERALPPCNPPVGTIGYRLDRVPPSRPHYPFEGDHVHLYQMHQNPLTGQCFWHPIGITDPPPPEGAVPLP